MKKPLAITLLILTGYFVTTAIPLGAMALGRFTEIPFAVLAFAVIAVIMMQTAAFALLRRLYKTKYGLSSPKFVVCSVLPSTGIAALGMIVINLMVSAGVFGELDPHFYPDDRAFLELSAAWMVIVYAVCFTVTLSAALAVISGLEKRRECPKKSFMQIFSAVNGVLMVILGIAFLFLFNLIYPVPLTCLIILIPHIAASVIVFLKSERKFGMRSGEFLCWAVVPSLALNIGMFALSLLFVMIGGGYLGYAFAAAAFFAGMYSLAYLIGTAVVMGFAGRCIDI